MNRAVRSLVVAASCFVVVCSVVSSAVAQEQGAGRGRGRRGQPPNDVAVAPDANASETERRLQELLQQYPPSLSRVLALDPTLLANDEYLKPYPQLAALLAQHPEIAHNPTYFFEPQIRDSSRRNYDYNEPRLVAIREIGGAFAGLAGLAAGMTFLFTLAWVIRMVIDHRKWLRVSATHVQTHTKLMDRLTSNEDLLAYMQSPAGRRFLEAAPIPVETAPRTLGATFNRILWSVQAGVVVAALGMGLMFASRHLAESEYFADGQVPLLIVGIAALAIGIGFFVSALAAYGLSHRLGLLAPPAAPADSGIGQSRLS